MRRVVFLSMLAALTAPIMTAQTTMKIATFETAITSAGFKIGTYSDKSMNGTSVIKIKKIEGPAGRGNAMDLSGSITTDYPYGFAGLHIPLTKSDAEATDISAFKGLRFTVRGDGQSYLLEVITQGVKDYDDFSFVFKPTGEWTSLDVPFTKLKQMGFGAPVKWSGKDVTAIRFQVQTFGAAISHYEFALDDVELY